MADDPAPPRTVPATSKDFRHIAKSTGEEVKDALQKGLEPATRTTFYAFFDNASFDIETSEGKSNILNKVKDHFKKEEFPSLHPVGTLKWHRVSVIEKATSIDRSRYSDRKEDRWVLVLFAKEEKKIGRHYSLHDYIEVGEEDVLLGYEVVPA